MDGGICLDFLSLSLIFIYAGWAGRRGICLGEQDKHYNDSDMDL